MRWPLVWRYATIICICVCVCVVYISYRYELKLKRMRRELETNLNMNETDARTGWEREIESWRKMMMKVEYTERRIDS